jgi:hypothetical protein
MGFVVDGGFNCPVSRQLPVRTICSLLRMHMPSLGPLCLPATKAGCSCCSCCRGSGAWQPSPCRPAHQFCKKNSKIFERWADVWFFCWLQVCGVPACTGCWSSCGAANIHGTLQLHRWVMGIYIGRWTLQLEGVSLGTKGWAEEAEGCTGLGSSQLSRQAATMRDSMHV